MRMEKRGMRRWYGLLVVTWLGIGCMYDWEAPGAPDGGGDVGVDGAIMGDAGAARSDGGEPDAFAGRDGAIRDPACVGVTCAPGASCHEGDCHCVQGYEGDGGVCVRDECVALEGEPEPCGAHARCVDPSTAVGDFECSPEEGVASCDGEDDPEPGYETDLRSDSSHCGACGYACAGDLACRDRTCDQAAHGLEMGTSLSCALVGEPTEEDAHALSCWGSNRYFQLRDEDVPTGDVADNFRATPARVTGVDEVRDVAIGHSHVCVLAGTSDQVMCWGNNSSFQLGTDEDAGITELVSTSMPGTVELAGGAQHTCALATDGLVRCWGTATRDALGDTVAEGEYARAEPRAVVNDGTRVAAAWYLTCVVVSDGSVKCWGKTSASPPRRSRPSQGAL